VNTAPSESEEPQADARTVFLCLIEDLSEGEVRAVSVEGLPAVAVYRINGRYYATDDCCTHANALLSDGYLKGDIIECPLHGGAFHVPSGRPTDLPCVIPLRTYRIQIVENKIFAVLEN